MGNRTRGYGYKNRHKGKGSKGGKGRAWCKHLWVKTLKYAPKSFGKHGFHNPTRKEMKVINVGMLCELCDHLIEHDKTGAAKKEGKAVRIDLKKLGVDKVLGFGRVDRPLIILGQASKSAVKKIEQAGGKVNAR